MSSKTLCNLIRVAVAAMAVCGIIAFGVILPTEGKTLALYYPEFAHCYYPWLIFLWVAALPCFAILLLVWKVSTAVKREQVFTMPTARLVKISAILLFGDVGFFFAGNIVLPAVLNAGHPSIFLASLFINVFGVSLALIAAALSRYLTKAAALQEEADGTV